MKPVTQERIQEALELTETIQIRGRQKSWFWLDNAILDEHGPELGPYGLAVYIALCRYANNGTQETFVGQQTIADKTGMSLRQVKDTMHQIEALHLIQITYRPGRSSLITLVDPTPKDTRAHSARPPCTRCTTPVHTVHPNKTILSKLTEPQTIFSKRLEKYQKEAIQPPPGIFAKLMHPNRN